MAEPGACALVLLAAGGSSRMGKPKQLLPVDGMPLVRRVVLNALEAHLHPTIVVLGAHAAQLRVRLEDLAATLVENPRWQDGMASSLRVGVEAACAANGTIRGLIVMLADQPRMNAAHLMNLEATQRTCGNAIVASHYGDHLGPPAYFGREHFSALLALRGDAGARELIRDCAATPVQVPPDIAADLDTASDYSALRGSP